MSIVTKNIKQYLENLISNKIEIQHEHEQFLGHHYIEMLEYPDLIQKILKTSNHHRILKIALEHDSDNQLNYEKIIMYIINQLNIGNLNTNVLLSLIDPTKLKKEDLYKITKCKNVDNSFFKIPYSFIFETIENESKQNKNSINILQQTISDGFSQVRNLCDMITSFKQELSSKIDQYKESINNEIKNIKDQISKTIDDNKSIQLISTKIDRNELECINHLLEMKFSIDNARKEMSKDIIDTKNSVNLEIDNLKNEILKKVEDNKNSIESESQKIDDLFPSKINEYKNSIIDEIKNIKKQISTNLTDTKSAIHSEITNSELKLLNRIDNTQSSIASNISLRTEQLSLNIKNGQDLLKTAITSNTNDKINSIITSIENAQNQISSSINENQNAISNDIKSVKDNIPKIIDNSQKINEILNAFNLTKTSICSDISDTKMQLLQKINKNQREIKSQIKSSESNNYNKINEDSKEIIEKIEFVSKFVTFKEILPIRFNFDRDKSKWNGLFDFCYSKIGNPFESRIIEITGNSKEGYEDALKCIGDKNNEYDWKSENSEGSYIKFDFKNRKFFFEGMEICNHSKSSNTMKCILLKGSNDDSDWTTINNWTLNDSLPRPNSTCSAWKNNYTSHPNGFYRYLKLETSGLNTSNKYKLCLKKIELYGTYQ